MKEGHPHQEILVFEVEAQYYGLPVPVVQELVHAVTIVPLPLSAPRQAARVEAEANHQRIAFLYRVTTELIEAPSPR